jgi:uncharacterized protein (TIGR03083 family)
VAFLGTLTPQQWQAPTLCARWRVRDMVAHVISYDDRGAGGLLALAARGRFRSGRINAAALARYDTSSPERLLALLAGHLQPGELPAALSGRVGLAETLIHHPDIRRALGQPRTIPPGKAASRAAYRLDRPGHRRVLAHPRAPAGRHRPALLRRRGPQVQGPAEALLMTIAGRRGVVSELSGPGRATLAGRIGG